MVKRITSRRKLYAAGLKCWGLLDVSLFNFDEVGVYDVSREVTHFWQRQSQRRFRLALDTGACVWLVQRIHFLFLLGMTLEHRSVFLSCVTITFQMTKTSFFGMRQHFCGPASSLAFIHTDTRSNTLRHCHFLRRPSANINSATWTESHNCVTNVFWTVSRAVLTAIYLPGELL